MRWTSSVSEHVETGQAVVSLLESLHDGLEGADPDLLFVFASRAHAPRYAVLVQALRDAFPRATLIGCGADHVIGGGREVEGRPALAIAGARLPGVEIQPFRIDTDAVDALVRHSGHAGAALGLGPDETCATLLLGDPFSAGTEDLVRALDRILPGSLKLGGIASGADRPGNTALFLDDAVHTDGWVGLSLAGRLRAHSIVAQGCRPIGTPMFVTRCNGNVLAEIDGRPPLEIVQELFDAADTRERALLQSSLLLGIQMRADQTEYERGDFLVRNLIGGDPESGVLSVAASLEPAQVVQFHVRDAHTASEDLDAHLLQNLALRGRARGALLFSCLGRGRGLYGVPNHDCDKLRGRLGAIPIAGFFGNGEIGPVHERTFLHTYTSAFGLFSDPG